MKLSTIIRHWPEDQDYSTHYRRVIRAAEKIPLIQGDEINANSPVTEEEIRRIIGVMPKSTPGHEDVEAFLLTHPEGFPEQQWKKYCEEKEVEKSGLYRAIQGGFDEMSRQIKDEINKINNKIQEIEDRIDKLERR